MKTVTIGIRREDGDFAVLATLNNNDDHLTKSDFEKLIRVVKSALFWGLRSFTKIEVLERQDAPDYVNTDEGVLGMKHRPQTYEEYVDTMRSYKHIPADYRLWKSWQDYYDTLRPERIQLRAEYERQQAMRII